MTSNDLNPEYERVYTVVDYYDGPRKGIANFRGKPHLYQCIFDESRGDYSESFLLAQIDPETLQIAVEDWAIFQRWELAYHTGTTDFSTHPALPHETQRHNQLQDILQQRLVIDPATAVRCIEHFEAIGGVILLKGVLRPMQVKWTEA